MCGVVAIWTRTGLATELSDRCEAMRDALRHRGPDAAGLWSDAHRGIALGHRRLSIIDLSPAGAQPMASRSGRWKVAYNGEIYNFEALRVELPDQPWRGHSDTEVLCAALDHWGLKDTVRRLRGMFAIVAWDAEDDVLWLARDRAGQKPLYWTEGPTILVGSELRVLQVDRSCPDQVDLEAVGDLVRWGHIRQPRTMLRGVQQLAPGSLACIPRRGPARLETFWDVRTALGAPSPAGSFDEAVERVESTLTEAVQLRLVGDVPVGTLLSGGVDSSLITALACRGGARVRTYTVAVDAVGYDESEGAAQVAAHLGTEHHTLPLRTDTLRDRVPALAAVQDEPMGDSSLLPTWLVSELAREHVTVALGGDGGDELFGGYDRYHRAMAAYRWNRLAPGLARRIGRRLAGPLDRLGERAPRARGVGRARRLVRRGTQLCAADLDGLYTTMMQATAYPELFVDGVPDSQGLRLPSASEPVRRLMAHDFVDYLPNDILVKTDRASMATSLELRAPLLDHEVVELAYGLPGEWTWAGGEGKRILRTILAQHVPKSLWDRPKQGFAVPISDWLRGDLRPWAESLLSEAALTQTGFWKVAAIRRRWARHLAGEDHRDFLWTVLQVQGWTRR